MSSNFQAASAIILAAGVGRRLGAAHSGPKSLLSFAGESLLARQLGALQAHGVGAIAVTVGYERQAIAAEVERLGLAGRVALVDNPDFRQGSLVSLWTQRERLRAGRPVILMDADVLCDARMVGRLGQGGAGGTEVGGLLLVDRELEPGDEPVKVCFRGERIVDFRKRPDDAGEWFGESVGFFRFSAPMAAALADRCQAYVDQGRRDVEYEEAIRDLILRQPDAFAAVDVTDLPWTEIDFEEDVVRARDQILPKLVA